MPLRGMIPSHCTIRRAMFQGRIAGSGARAPNRHCSGCGNEARRRPSCALGARVGRTEIPVITGEIENERKTLDPFAPSSRWRACSVAKAAHRSKAPTRPSARAWAQQRAPASARSSAAARARRSAPA